MRIVRVGDRGGEQPGLLVDDTRWVPLRDVTVDVDSAFLGRIARGAFDPAPLLTAPARPLAGVRLGPPIPRPGKIVCIGLNYADHAAESGMPIPAEPIVFMKAPDTLVGPFDDVHIPRGSRKTDWEVELGIVIGERCRYLARPEDAEARIAGWVISNDVSEREFQLERGGQWDKGKSCETFNPCGPWLVTRDEVPDVQSLAMYLDVNGVRRQTGSTATMVFDALQLVWYLSQFMVLEPGDLVNTGTPPGVGMGARPEPSYLRAGDVMELGVERLGVQRQRVIAAP